MFFGKHSLDRDLPLVNEVFWSCLIEHIEADAESHPRAILDVGCHTGGLLKKLAQRFHPNELVGIEPLASAREAALGWLRGTAPSVVILDVSQWDDLPTGSIHLITSHEVLYLEPDVSVFMERIRRVVAPDGVAYVVLGCHAENPVWREWKKPLVEAGHRVYDHRPMDILAAASSVGFLPSVQPLRSSGWVTYDPVHAEFHYPDLRTMLEHHYRHKLVFRLKVGDASAKPS